MAVDKPDRNYDVRNLNKVFAIGSIVLTITVLLMIIDDYVRPWKDFQRRTCQAAGRLDDLCEGQWS